MTILCTIELFCILINLVGSTMDDTIQCWDITYLIVVVCEVGTYTINKVLANLIIPGKTKFDTLILYITTIDDWTLGTCCCKNRSLYQPILGVLDISIECQRKTLTEETCIDTEIVLFRSLPLHFLICQAASVCTHYPGICTTGSTKVVVGFGCCNRSQILEAVDIGITYLTPRETEFQEIQPRSSRLHELFLCQCPTCRNRWEVTPTVASCKLRRTIGTHGCINHITVFP